MNNRSVIRFGGVAAGFALLAEASAELYRRFKAPWDLGPRKELVEVVKNGHIPPCKAIDLGCGKASNAIFLVQHGFDVTGTDYSAAAIQLCQQRGAAAGVSVNWIEDDLTHLQHVKGKFDFLVDWVFMMTSALLTGKHIYKTCCH